MVLSGLLLTGLMAVSGWGEDPLPAYKPADYGSAYACYPTCILPNYIVAEDFNQDGWLDLAVSCFATSDVWTYRNLGNPVSASAPGAFSYFGGPAAAGDIPGLPGQFAVGLGPIALATGHVSAYNGFPDVAVLSQIAPGMSRVDPNANGTAPIGLPGPALVRPVHFAVGDFDHTDRILDFAVIDVPPLPAVPTINLYYNGALAGPPVPAVPPPGIPCFIVVADFDDDGWDDIAVVTTGTNRLLISYGPGFAAWVPAYGLGFIPTAMDVGDFNADGFLDIVVVGNTIDGSGLAEVFLNNVRAHTFAGQGVMQTWGFNTTFVEVLDADGNGRDDFVTANHDSHTLTVFLAYINGTEKDDRAKRPECCLCDAQSKKDKIKFKGFKIELECGYFPTCLVRGDFDRNGRMDLAVTLYSATKEVCPQNPSCIELIFDVACDAQEGQELHRIDPKLEPQGCDLCKEEPCKENVPPKAEIQTESGTKNP